MEPGRGFMSASVAMVNVVSVWPNPSYGSWPETRANASLTSAGMASPAVVTCSSVEKSTLERSSFTRKRKMVGGAQKVVMPYCLNIGSMSAAWKRSKS